MAIPRLCKRIILLAFNFKEREFLALFCIITPFLGNVVMPTTKKRVEKVFSTLNYSLLTSRYSMIPARRKM